MKYTLRYILIGAAVILTVITWIIGLDALVEMPPLTWSTSMADAAAIGILAAQCIRKRTKRFSTAGIMTATSAILTLFPGIQGLYLYFFGKGWSDLVGLVVLVLFALPLLIATVICLICWRVQRKKARNKPAEQS